MVSARVVRKWSYQDVLDKSDWVVIATPIATADTKERIDLPGLPHHLDIYHLQEPSRAGRTDNHGADLSGRGAFQSETGSSQSRDSRWQDQGEYLQTAAIAAELSSSM